MQRNKINCQKCYHSFVVLSFVLLAAILLQSWGISVKAADPGNPGQPTPGSTGQPNPGLPAQDGAQGVRPEQPITTKISGQGRNVTLTINLEAYSQATSGRLKIRYPKDLLVLSSTQSGNLWKVEDLNTEMEESTQKVIAYAWADTEAKTNAGTILTLNLEAQNAASGREITVETEIVELFSQQERIVPKNDKIIDRLRTDFTVTSSQAGGAVRTGDDTNVALYVLLGLGSILVMVGLVRSKVEH